MKRIFSLLMLAAFSVAIIGCEASGTVGDTDDHDTSYKRTTVEHPNGDTSVKTEVHHDR